MSSAGAVRSYARVYASDIAGLPGPDETWQFGEVDIDRGLLQSLHKRGMIRTVEHPPGDRPKSYTVRQDLYEQALDFDARQDGFDCCGGTGITNDAGTLRCGDCGESVTREEIEEVLR